MVPRRRAAAANEVRHARRALTLVVGARATSGPAPARPRRPRGPRRRRLPCVSAEWSAGTRHTRQRSLRGSIVAAAPCGRAPSVRRPRRASLFAGSARPGGARGWVACALKQSDVQVCLVRGSSVAFPSSGFPNLLFHRQTKFMCTPFNMVCRVARGLSYTRCTLTRQST